MSLNTTPRTWVAGEVVTAALMNTEIRDALTGVQAAWVAYTPTMATWTLGNGTLVGAWRQVGKAIDWRVKFTQGNTTTTTASFPTFTLPIAPIALTSGTGEAVLGQATLGHSGTFRQWAAVSGGGSLVTPADASGALLTNASPWAWASTDYIYMAGRYETP